ncbi:hypothetical protein Tco_1440309 [Tanacetum coccineum]
MNGQFCIEHVGRFVFEEHDFLRRWEGQGEYKKGIMLREDGTGLLSYADRSIQRYSCRWYVANDNHFKTTEKSNAGGLNKRVKEKSLSSSTKLLEEVKDQKMEELEEDDTKALRGIKKTLIPEIRDNEDVHDLRYVETEFPAIVFNDTLTSEATLSCEPTVSSLNDNEIYFRISFDESDDEDYTPLFYNDALTSKSDFSTEPTLSPQHIDELDLKDETSLLECGEEEQNILYFNDVFSFNVIYPDHSKSDKDNDDDKIDIK